MVDLQGFFNAITNYTNFPCSLGQTGGYVRLQNSGRRGSVKEFTLSLEAILQSLKDIKDNMPSFQALTTYEESAWRETSEYFTDLGFKSLITVQTKPCFTVLSKIIAWANEVETTSYNDNEIDLTVSAIDEAICKLDALLRLYTPKARNNIKVVSQNHVATPKPFLLLAGISGTGKTRFVRQQALASGSLQENYCLVPVRPDWHEPSDLLGYISRLGAEGAEYIVTDVTQFIVKAWCALFDAGLTFEKQVNRLVLSGSGAILENIKPYWLCLDEMNLAPVEQYFADYLSVLETIEWVWDEGEFQYSSDPLLSPVVFEQLNEGNQNVLRHTLGLDHEQYNSLWGLITEHGLGIPFNLIVAGTVNMDETTHGFSRKVIDRALCFDFGEFFPNDFSQFFEPRTQVKTLTFPIWSHARKTDLASVQADADGKKTIEFLSGVNGVLAGSPFELAYRALNELLLSVVVFSPKDELELQAVWDDFLMCKVLPRIEGDLDKLQQGERNILHELEQILELLLGEIWADSGRLDLYREQTDGTVLTVDCRSRKKLAWMKERLASAGFTSFWP